MKNKKTVEIPQKDNLKIAIIGHSGSGKSTLAAFLGERFSVPVLHNILANFFLKKTAKKSN